MSSWGKRLIVLAFCASIGTFAFGQDWPKPAKTPNTDVLCNTSSCDSTQTGKKLVGYPLPLTTFVGRYVDSTKTDTRFFPVRTHRSRFIRFAPERKRIYMALGSTVMAYDIDSFFTRLAAGEALYEAGSVSGYSEPSGTREKVLNDDRLFYPAQAFGGSAGGDGEERLYKFDWDDRGYVYASAGEGDWGIALDDGKTGGGPMTLIYHRTSTTGDQMDKPSLMVSFKKSTGAYYVIAASDENSGVDVFNVSTPTNPTREGSLSFLFKDFAKNADGTRIALIGWRGQVNIYSNDSIGSGSPIAEFPGPYNPAGGMSSDGTNFFTTSLNGNNQLVITVFSPSGSTFTAKSFTTSVRLQTGSHSEIFTSPDSGGYLTVNAFDSSYNNAGNVRLFKFVNNDISEVSLDGYVAKFYGNQAPAGYMGCVCNLALKESHVFKKGAKYYFFVSYFGLGDVYELKGADSLTAKIKRFGKTTNSNSKAPASSGPYYGDEITFTSDHTSTTAPSVTWEFGDNVVQTITPGTVGAPDVAHQYGGLIAANLPATRTVKASNAGDPSMTDSINVTLARPTPRVGVLGTSILFTQATTDLTLPIVSSDFFYDGSDGAVEGHYSEWRLLTDTASTKLIPSQTFGVGAVGDRELTFIGHYGPYTGTGATLAAPSDAAFPITPIRYRVRGFAPVVSGPLAGGANVLFRNATRTTTNTTDLPNGAATVVSYAWDLLKSDNTVVGTAAVPASSAISAIPDFSVPRGTFAGSQNWKVRLTMTLGNTTETAFSGPLTGPTPGPITKTGCDNVGASCSLSTPSTVTGNDPSTWTYLWTVSGPGTVPNASTAVFQPVFPTAGTYTVTVNISNALGDATPLQLNVTVGPSLCSSNPTNTTTSITFIGRTSRCVDTVSPCNVNETIDFSVTPFGWLPGSCDRYSWNFGDGTQVSSATTPSHAYAGAGTYTVTVTVTGGLSNATVSKSVKVGSSAPPPPPPPPPPAGCGTMVAGSNVYVSYLGGASGCTPSVGSCNANESVPFHAQSFGYNFACANHTLVWNFGDNSQSVTSQDYSQIINHAYAAAGTFNLTLQISNGTQNVTVTQPVKVGGGGGGGTSCPTMTPGSNVFIGYIGATSGCTLPTDQCKASETINFSASNFGYLYSCATHTFEWTFGDGGTSTAQNVAHSYASAGDYKVTLKITNPAQNVTIERTVKVVGTNNCPTMTANQNIFLQFLGLKSHCSASGGTCQEDEEIAFGANALGYNFACSAHSFLWTFGDGTTSTEQSPTHTYDGAGDFDLTVKISNSKQELVIPVTVSVAPAVTKRRSTRH